MEQSPEQALSAWVAYLREMGVYDLYRREESSVVLPTAAAEKMLAGALQASARAEQTVRMPSSAPPSASPRGPLASARTPERFAIRRDSAVPAPGSVTGAQPDVPITRSAAPLVEPARSYFNQEGQGASASGPGETLRSPGAPSLPPELAAPMPKPNPLELMFAQLPAVPAKERAAALERLRAEIGDCTRCPLAYAGRHTIVFGEGDPNAELMFIGEGPGADEDASGQPFVGKAGQLLNNMIGAMGLQREQVFIANIVKCRPPGNRAPEFVEATTCSQFLLKQIDIVRPKVIVALGATAATYVLGVRQSLSSLRGQWLAARGAKVAVTYHPAFLLRDPRQKSEAWKDLQRVMAELGLKPATKNG